MRPTRTAPFPRPFAMPLIEARTLQRARALRRRTVGVLVLLMAGAVEAWAQDDRCTTRRPRVEGLTIEGNVSITDFDLRSIIYTERAGRLRRWFGWSVGPASCLDSLELLRDERRIAAWYGMRGYPGTIALSSFARTGDRTATVAFLVKEQDPVLIDSVHLLGIPERLVNQRRLAQQLRGEPLDDSVLVAVLDSVQQLLRAEGYARARPPSRTVVIDTIARRARVTLEFRPNGLVRVGSIEVALTANDSGNPALDDGDVRALLRFRPGDVYSSRAVGSSQQLLYSSELYRTVAIDTLPTN